METCAQHISMFKERRKRSWKGRGTHPGHSNRSKRNQIFQGKMEGHTPDAIRNYEQTYSDYNFTAEQKLRYLQNLFQVEAAIKYSREELQHVFQSYEKASSLSITKYSSIKE